MANEASPHTVSDGYAIGYARGKGAFRVYICFALGVALLGVWLIRGSELALVFAVFFGGASYYHYPLIEFGKVRLGAGQYGVFIEGLGIIPWGAVKNLKLSTYAVRTLEINELHVELARSLPKSLMADWRSMPYHRLLMKLPWSMGRDNIIRVNLEPFADDPEAIYQSLVRNWRYFKAAI